VIPEAFGLSEGEFAIAVQNFAITIEMFGIAILHLYAFPADMYRIQAQSQAPLVHQIELGGSSLKSILSSVNQTDILKDTQDAFTFHKRKKYDQRRSRRDSISDFHDSDSDVDHFFATPEHQEKDNPTSFWKKKEKHGFYQRQFDDDIRVSSSSSGRDDDDDDAILDLHLDGNDDSIFSAPRR